MGFQIQICPILRVFWSILVKRCVHLPTSSSKTQMLLLLHKYWLFSSRLHLTFVAFCLLSVILRWIKEWGTANFAGGGGVVCFSRDFAFRINILNSISTPHKHSFFIITNILSVSRDLPHPFWTFYFNPNLHHFINNTCNLIHFLPMTIDTKIMGLIGVFLNYLRFVNYNVSC